MQDAGTSRKQLLVLEAPRERLRPMGPASSDFLSQMIAERQHLAPQRAKRRAAPAEAVDAYASGSRIAVRRMPAGYRTTILA